MIIFNTTFHVDDSLKNKFLDFIKNSYVPKALTDNILKEPRLSEILSQEEHPEGTNYALQFLVSDVETLNIWYKSTGLELNKDLAATFGQKVAGFSTVMRMCDL